MPTTEKEALHTAARRYCIERRRFWVERYIELRRGGDQPAYGYSTKDYATFPRYRILNGILFKAERVTPKEFATVDDLPEYLVLAGRTAEDSFTRSPSNEVAARAIEEEQDFFCAYVERLRVHDLRRRTVALTPRLEPGGSPGVCGLRSTLAGALAKGYSPTHHQGSPQTVLVFQAVWFYEELPTARLQSIFAKHSIERVYKLREGTSVW